MHHSVDPVEIIIASISDDICSCGYENGHVLCFEIIESFVFIKKNLVLKILKIDLQCTWHFLTHTHTFICGSH